MEDRMIERVTTLEGSMKTAFNNIEKHDEELKEIRTDNKILHEMSKNISVLATNYENQGKTITRIECDVKDLKDKPAKRWDALTAVIITAIASGTIGFALSKVFGG